VEITYNYYLKLIIMKKLLLTFSLVILMTSLLKGQDYDNGFGIRLGWTQGLTIKHFFSERTAVEGILATRWKGFDLTGLFEIHDEAFEVDRLRWYFGFGGHLGFWNGDNTPWGDDGENYSIIGIDGILGIEYTFLDIPINIGLDWKPMFNLSGYSGFWADGGALSLRYTF
jgi:hypothetical protein